MKIFKQAILSLTNNEIIAIDGKLASKSKTDSEFLNEKTKNTICVVGLNTFLDLPDSLLQDRSYVVVTSLFDELYDKASLYMKRQDCFPKLYKDIAHDSIKEAFLEEYKDELDKFDKFITDCFAIQRYNHLKKLLFKSSVFKSEYEDNSYYTFLFKLLFRYIEDVLMLDYECQHPPKLVLFEHTYKDFLFVTPIPDIDLLEKQLSSFVHQDLKCEALQSAGIVISVLGGSNIYNNNLTKCDKIYISRFKKQVELTPIMQLNKVHADKIIKLDGSYTMFEKIPFKDFELEIWSR